MAVVGLKNLCTPALIYMSFSLLVLALLLFYSFSNVNVLCLGESYSSCTMVFVLKVVYILFWTWILNIICKNGDEAISWVLLLMPVILLAFLVVYYYVTA